MTIGRQRYGVHFTDTTDSGSQAVRYWLPPATALGASIPLVIWCHPYTQTQAIAGSYFAYPLVHSCIQEGFMVAASNMHGDSWANDNALTDVVNLYTLMNSIQPVSGVVIVGASMGGLATALTAAKANLPTGKLKGLMFLDAVLSLNWAYTGNSGGYTSGINTAYGVASYAAIPAGHEPLSFAASAYAGLRMRFYASTTDTSVDKASNTDAMRTLIAAQVSESGLVTHNLTGHLNTGVVQAPDQMAFLHRCLG